MLSAGWVEDERGMKRGSIKAERIERKREEREDREKNKQFGGEEIDEERGQMERGEFRGKVEKEVERAWTVR